MFVTQKQISYLKLIMTTKTKILIQLTQYITVVYKNTLNSIHGKWSLFMCMHIYFDDDDYCMEGIWI